MVYDTMAMLFEKLALFLDGTRGFHYIRDDHRMEIWLSEKEELPIIVSNMGNSRYIISSGDLSYELKNEARAFRYIMRIFFNMDGISIDHKFIRWSLHTAY